MGALTRTNSIVGGAGGTTGAVPRRQSTLPSPIPPTIESGLDDASGPSPVQPAAALGDIVEGGADMLGDGADDDDGVDLVPVEGVVTAAAGHGDVVSDDRGGGD